MSKGDEFVNPDLVVCDNGSVWSTINIKEPKNLSKAFQEKKISINFVQGSAYSYNQDGESYILGGPTGLWSNSEGSEFEECKEIPGFYSWMGVKDFKNCEFEWFFHNFDTYYFNAKGNVYSKTPDEPYYELVWENRQIIQLNGGQEDETFRGCLLDNGEVWVQNNPNMDCFPEDEFPPNDAGWSHLPVYDDKKVKSVLAMEAAIYVLCESPEQKLFYHSDMPQSRNREGDDEEEGEDENTVLQPSDPSVPTEDKSISSKKVLKMVCLSEIILCLCEEGLYAWVVDNGATPFPDTEEHPVCKYSKQFYPVRFFENKKILDIGASEHLYVLCDDGVYTIPSKVEDDQDDEDVEIVPIKLSLFDENVPVMFSTYTRSKLGKSARSRIDTEEQPPAKKQKLEHEEEKTDS